MALQYYGSKLSENRIKTPNGGLICKNTPIARTGWQDYLGSEIGVDNPGIVKVWRDPKEVFSDATIASFEGRPITDQHPTQMIDPNNFTAYTRGHIQNVRRGTRSESDFLIADLLFEDACLISKVESGQKEISCGYNCDYIPMGDGQFAQVNIIGNHAASVPSGRAGQEIAVKDAKPEIKEVKKEKRMVKDIVKHIFGLGFKKYAEDAEPEEVAKAMEAVEKGKEQATERNKDSKCGKDEESEKERIAAENKKDMEDKAAKDAEAEGGNKEILELLKSIAGRLDKLESAEKAEVKDSPEKQLDSFLEELTGEKEKKDDDKEKDSKDAGVIEPVETLTGKELPVNPIPGADAAAIVAAVRAMKPVIAAMKDPATKKAATDALIAGFKPQSTQDNGSYAAMLKGKHTADAGTVDDTDFGKTMKEKYHRKGTPGGK